MGEKILGTLKKYKILWLTLLSGILGLTIFILIYSTEVLNVTKDEWLHDSWDLTQHYYGWMFFRDAKWTFPIGMFQTLSYPNYASIIFTDSIPLFAIFFKLLSSILPETFQYFGIYGMICYILQGVFAFTLLRKFIHNHYYSIVRNSIFHYLSLFIAKNV